MNSMLDDWPMKMVKDGIRCTRDRCWGVVMYGESCSLGFLRVALVRHIQDRHTGDGEIGGNVRSESNA